ncbi:MAG: acyl carrier protein [Kiritimatiellia bacterium]
MTQADFLGKAAEVLEVESVTPETRFRELPGWCSLQAFGLLVLLENECGVRMDLEMFRRCETVGELYHG